MSNLNLFAIRLNAGNTTNGNPRRVYVVIDAGTGIIVKAIDERHEGINALTNEFPSIKPYMVRTFDTTPAEYRELLKDYGNK